MKSETEYSSWLAEGAEIRKGAEEGLERRKHSEAQVTAVGGVTKEAWMAGFKCRGKEMLPPPVSLSGCNLHVGCGSG